MFLISISIHALSHTHTHTLMHTHIRTHSQLFKRLAGMIQEQSEMVERIDDDVESARGNADAAHSLLLKTYEVRAISLSVSPCVSLCLSVSFSV